MTFQRTIVPRPFLILNYRGPRPASFFYIKLENGQRNCGRSKPSRKLCVSRKPVAACEKTPSTTPFKWKIPGTQNRRESDEVPGQARQEHIISKPTNSGPDKRLLRLRPEIQE